MTPEELISSEAVELASTDSFKKELKNKFLPNHEYHKAELPVTVFMSGAPGAGKTEFSKSLHKRLGNGFIRLDPDDIRALFPLYNGTNSSLFQRAVSRCVDYLFHRALAEQYHIILDGTLKNQVIAKNNISKCLKMGRMVLIFFIYQDPKISWKFTQDREKEEGRNIKKDVFIEGFLRSIDSVKALKNEFGSQISLNFVDMESYKARGFSSIQINLESIDHLLGNTYTKETLESIL